MEINEVSELKKKQDAQSQLLRQKQKSDDAAKRLQDEIQRIKSHKLKKEARRNEYEMHKLLALNQRQKMVLQWKTEEALLATKRLRELLESNGTCDTSCHASRPKKRVIGSGHASGPGIQPLMQAIKHELEVRFRVHEVRTANERQMQERAAMAKEVARLKEESENFKQKIMSDCLQTMSPSARNSRIVAQENMLAATSGMLVCMASQLSEAEEREHVFSGRDRWNQIYSLAEAKNLMNNLFNLASSSRCQLRDKEVTCREKDSVIGELKEKVVTLNSLVKKLEGQLVEVHDQNLQRVASIKSSGENGQSYVLRKEGREKLKVDRISKWRLSRPSRVGVYISTPATQSTQLVPITLIREWQPQQ